MAETTTFGGHLDVGGVAYQAAKLFASGDVQGIRRLHNALVTDVAINHDEGLWRLALITYVLSKILAKGRYWKGKRAQGWADVIRNLQSASEFFALGKKAQAQKSIVQAYKKIESADDGDRRYIRGLFAKAALKSASTLYAKGISLGRSSEIAGLDKHELLSYAGQTTMHERITAAVGVDARMKRLRTLFAR